ncbi:MULTISPECIES: amidohydrolase family protein [Amycolatopsis]|uniref:Metal-dependent hydrolase n=2 Tax=Amycolatopsis TaxID=1813 RepID=A0A076N4L6_AMYME|nr:amidohydrolase family protein [Amycolatopsis methanolica]AIJ26231.1 metal-dependent hydrolase [Amycolatopsis methanolica 239]
MTTDPLVSAVHARTPLSGVDVIDAHAHLGPYSLFFTPDPSADAMVRVMDRCGVRRTILSATMAIELDARRGNEQTAEATERHPGRLCGYVVVNPHQDPAAELSRWATHPGMVGLKLHPSLHHYPVTGPRYADAWAYAEETGRPVLVHTWTGSDVDDPEQVAEVARRYPKAKVLLGHSGARPDGFARAIELAATHPNLYLEICGSHFTGRWLTRMVAALGAHRVIYGSDFPFIDLRYSIGRVVFAELDLADRATVLGGAIRTLLEEKS